MASESSNDPVKAEKKPPALSTSSRPPLAPQTISPTLGPQSNPPPLVASLSTESTSSIPVPTIQPSLKQENANAGHKRNVSWGTATLKLQQPELPPANGSGRITQEELAARSPVETEVESNIINSLENRDPTTGAPSQKSVLSNITDADLKALNSTDSVSVVSHKSGGSSTRRTTNANNSSHSGRGSRRSGKFRSVANAVRSTQHRRKETIGDKLQGLAAAMEAVHLQHLDFLDDDPPSEVNLDVNPTSSSADAFHHNTNLLYQRHASQKQMTPDVELATTGQSGILSTTPMEIAASKGLAAERRWKLLKHAIAATNMADLKEKVENTEPQGDVDVSPGNGDSQHDSETSGSPQRQNSEDSAQKGPRSKRWRGRSKPEKFLRDLQDFVTPRQNTTWYFFKFAIFFVMIPSAAIAAILFYFGGNPPTGIVDLDRSAAEGKLINEDGDPISDKTASASWWLLFLGVRQMLVLMLAKFLEMFIIDFLSVRTKFSVKAFGPWATLFILQTKGWPFMCFTWGMLSIGLFSGTKEFFHHWGFFQDYIDLFNENNPSGEVVDSIWFHRVTAIAVALGLIVATKRFWLGLYLGRQTFCQFSDKLAAVMTKILLVSEVASLGRAFERYVNTHREQERRSISAANYGLDSGRLGGMITSMPNDPSGRNLDNAAEDIDMEGARYVIDPEDRHPMTGQLSMVQKERILTLLGAWAEPTLAEKKTDVLPTVNEILQFRRALEYLHTSYPFSGSFGLADRRESTIESSQEVYDRLLLRSIDPNTLHFDVIALLGVGRDGELDSEKLKQLIKLFRPDRDGTMRCVDFVKAIDEVYKELRLLRASVANSSKIDRAFERIFNFVFYAIVCCLILSQLGYDPLALFLSISGVILAFAFMIGSASSKYFEGLLFILARRPYQIGDGIALSGVNEQVLFTGSPMWVVEDVDLFTTKVVFSFTGEKATLSNGALAASRVINASESKDALLFALIKFPIEVSYNKLQTFREQLKEFFKNRPREWIAFTRFRPTRFEINEGFVEYIICAQHRLPWSKYGDLQQSKADLMHFCFELQKKMDLLYKHPIQPVDVTLRNAGNAAESLLTPMSPYQPPLSPGGSVSTANAEFAALQSLFAPKSD